MENPINLDDLGVLPFQETTILHSTCVWCRRSWNGFQEALAGAVATTSCVSMPSAYHCGTPTVQYQILPQLNLSPKGWHMKAQRKLGASSAKQDGKGNKTKVECFRGLAYWVDGLGGLGLDGFGWGFWEDASKSHPGRKGGGAEEQVCVKSQSFGVWSASSPAEQRNSR